MTNIFKYFDNKDFLNKFLLNGEVRFNSLSYFTFCEDCSKLDAFEDTNIFSPIDGLKITRAGETQYISGPSSLASRVKKADRIFIFCASLENNQRLYSKFKSQGCVQINDIEEFKRRIHLQIRKPFRNIKNKLLLADKVNYYERHEMPQSRHACPDQIIMSKTIEFVEEQEYRLAFAKDKNAFDVNNVTYFMGDVISPEKPKKSYQHLTLGNLTDICTLIKEE